MGRPLRVVPSANWHVTLRFLGDMSEQKLPALTKVLHDGVPEPLHWSVRITGVGAFPQRSRPSVVWVGLKPDDAIRQLATSLNQALGAIGIKPESKSFRAHVTLARLKGRPTQALNQLLTEMADTELGTCELGEVVLMQSELTSSGAVYRRVAIVK